MSRRGIALPVALLVVLLGGVLVATSVTWSITELKAGEAWAARARAGQATTSNLVEALPRLHRLLDTVPLGVALNLAPDTAPGGDLLIATRFADSVIELEAALRRGSGHDRVKLLARLKPDSTGAGPLGLAPRVHPTP